MIFQCTDNPTRSSNSKMYSCCDSERDSFFDNCVVDFMVAVTCVKIETRKDNRSEVCLVKCDNRKYNILCGSIFKVENGHFDAFIMFVTVKFKVKLHNTFQREISNAVVASITRNKLRFPCFILDI